MKILNIRTIPGPNVYSHQPVLVMKLDLEDLAGRGKTVEAGEPGRYLVAVTYKSEKGMKALLRIAVELVQALVDDRP